MHPDMMCSLIALLAGEDLLAVDEARVSRVSDARDGRSGSITVIPVTGMLMARSYRGFFGTMPGMDALRAQIGAAARNPDVSAIVLDFDSPGGTVAGTAETAAAVAAAREAKPVVAVANACMASAACWIGSQATELVVAPASTTGSIGVLAIHQNVAKLMERMGVEATIVRSGSRKAEGHPFAPLDDTARSAIQARVDEEAGQFLATVAAGRRLSLKAARDRFGDGRAMGASEAVSTGLADRVATLDQVISDLSAGRGRAFRRRSAIAFA